MLASVSTRPPESINDLIPPQLSAALDRIDLSSRRTFAGKLQGERRSKARGRSVEFEDYRQYVAGDDLRHVDWNVFARLDRLFIKVFLEEQDLAMHVAIDATASMDGGNPNKLLQAQRIAMALAYLGLVNNNRVVVWVFGAAGLRYLPPTRGRTGVQRVAAFLLGEVFGGKPEPGAEPTQAPITFTAAMRRIAQARTGKGVFVLLSDLLVPEGYEQGLSLLAGGWDTTVLQVLAPGEIDPSTEIDGGGGRIVIGDLLLTDAETGRAAEVTVNGDLLARYLKNFERYQQRLASYLTSRGMTHVVVRSDADVAELLLGELRRRGVVK
ncbi:MAG: DUF58 domain-containing protein [Phycisphaerales bacterium]